MKPNEYDQDCDNAATKQGLKPIMESLQRENVPFRLEQTGGFVMVVYVPITGKKVVGITSERDDAEGNPLYWLVWYEDYEVGDENFFEISGSAQPDTAALMLSYLVKCANQ